jgi:PAS domain S-box-containing protein
VIDASGKVTAVALFCRDITETRNILDNLAYVNECFSQALSGSEHILYRLNVKKGGYDYLSLALEKITGYQITEFMNNGLETVRELFHPDDVDAVFSAINDHIRTRTSNNVSIELEYRLRRADGSYCWLHDSTTVMVNESAEPELFFGSAYDVTGRKEMESALRESEEKYRRFIATANEGIGIVDADFRITYVNDRLTEMLGCRTEDIIGAPVSSLLPETEQMRLAATIKNRKDGSCGSVEYRHVRKDGSTVWVLVSSTPIFADDGSFRGCFAMLTDISARKEAEAILQQSYDELERRVFERTADLSEANKQIKRMSYELIRAQEGERSRIASELHDQVGQTLLLAKMRLDMLANDLSATPKRHATHVSELLETTIQDIRTLSFGLRPPLLDSAGIAAALEWLCSALMNSYHLKVNFCSDNKPILLKSGKGYAVYQAVRELLINVVKHAGVESADLLLSSDDTVIEVTVADAGIGFNPSSTSLLTSGTNLGLFNVHQRVDQVGGTVRIDSETGKGTVVTLRIPQTDQEVNT